MKTMLIAIAAIAALFATAVPATATPPCTCDPGPWNCLFTDGSAPPPGCHSPTVPPTPTVPPVPSPRDLDPRNWPCTCDPMPQLW